MRSCRRAFFASILSAPTVAFLMVGAGSAAKDDTTLVSLAKVVPGGKANVSTDAVGNVAKTKKTVKLR